MGLINSKELLDEVNRVIDLYTINNEEIEQANIPIKLLKKIIEKLELERENDF